MAKRQRFHIDLPEGDLWLTGNTVSEAFLNGFERYQKITQMPAEPSIPPSPSFREVFEQYQSIFWKKLRASTRTNYQHQANKRILPVFGHISIAEITVADIQSLYNRMEAEGLKRSTIDMVKKIMNPVMEYALKLGMIGKNPFHAKKLKICRSFVRRCLIFLNRNVFSLSCLPIPVNVAGKYAVSSGRTLTMPANS